MTEGSVECPLVVVEPERLRIVFATDINYDITFRELVGIPCPDNLKIFKPANISNCQIVYWFEFTAYFT